MVSLIKKTLRQDWYLDQEIVKKDFWKDANKSKKITKEKNFLEGILNFYKNTVNELNNLKDLNQLALEEENLEILNDCEKKISNTFKEIKTYETKCFLSGENDNLDIYIEIHAEPVEQKAKIGPIC